MPRDAIVLIPGAEGTTPKPEQGPEVWIREVDLTWKQIPQDGSRIMGKVVQVDKVVQVGKVVQEIVQEVVPEVK